MTSGAFLIFIFTVGSFMLNGYLIRKVFSLKKKIKQLQGG